MDVPLLDTSLVERSGTDVIDAKDGLGRLSSSQSPGTAYDGSSLGELGLSERTISAPSASVSTGVADGL